MVSNICVWLGFLLLDCMQANDRLSHVKFHNEAIFFIIKICYDSSNSKSSLQLQEIDQSFK